VLPHEVTLTLDGYVPARQVVQQPGEVTVHLKPARVLKHPPSHKRLLDE